jgi:hypothetical protein
MENPKVKVWIEGNIIFEKIVGILDGDDIHFSTEQVAVAAKEMSAKGLPPLLAIDVSQVKGLTREARVAMTKDFGNAKLRDDGGVVTYGLNGIMVATVKLLMFINPSMKITKFVSTREQAVNYLEGLLDKVK